MIMGPIKHKALINVDLGEGFGNWTITSDEDLLPFIDHANVLWISCLVCLLPLFSV